MNSLKIPIVSKFYLFSGAQEVEAGVVNVTGDDSCPTSAN